MLRTEIAFQAIPVLRMAYFTKRPYYGLFVKTHMLQPQAACEGGSRRRGQPLSLLRQTAPFTFFAPTQLFELRRCCGRLIFRKEYTVLFSPKRSTFSRFAACEGEPKEGEPLSLLRQTAPLTQGSRRRGQPLSLLRQTAPLTCFSRKRPAKGSQGGDNLSVWEL